jgi:hypothetical protein
MRANHDQQVIALFGGDRIAPGFRGRRHSPQVSNKAGYRIGVCLAVALIGFTTAAAAISIRNPAPTERSASAGANLTGGVAGSAGFEAALY